VKDTKAGNHEYPVEHDRSADVNLYNMNSSRSITRPLKGRFLCLFS
jgi:hypothetical protein